MNEEELMDLYNNDYNTKLEFGEFCYNKGNADERAKVFDEVIKTLAKSEDTMLSDKQYYTLMELKEQKIDG